MEGKIDGIHLEYFKRPSQFKLPKGRSHLKEGAIFDNFVARNHQNIKEENVGMLGDWIGWIICWPLIG